LEIKCVFYFALQLLFETAFAATNIWLIKREEKHAKYPLGSSPVVSYGQTDKHGETNRREYAYNVASCNAQEAFYLIAQVVSRRVLTAEARVRVHVSQCEICGRQSGTGTGCYLSPSLFPCQYHSTAAPYSPMYHLGAGQSVS
jgi:hypothetical protein